MTRLLFAYTGAEVFDGEAWCPGKALLVEDARVLGLVSPGDIPAQAEIVDLHGGTLAPGFVDLQVNGGGGVMLNDRQDVEGLRLIADAHARLGTAAILPTLITDTRETTAAAIAAVEKAIDAGVAGIAGLHLEGPHLSLARKGAHDPALIRPMDDADLQMLTQAAATLPALLLTVAPETVTPAQIAALVAAGATVSIGHSDAGLATCHAAADAGARVVTHLYNAMSQLGHREPGVVGTALSDGRLSAGLIADFVHVTPEAVGIALRGKAGPGRIFLVTDAMAPAGTKEDHFLLNGRRIERRDGRLTLADGTLAGADLDLATAIRNLVTGLDLPLAQALAMATSVPADVVGLPGGAGRLLPGGPASFVHLDAGLQLKGTWRLGFPIA